MSKTLIAPKKERRDPYAEVTDNIIAALNEGTVPWRKPWNTAVGMPRSLDGRPYRGINIMLLGSKAYNDPRWGTFRAIEKRGGKVKKGEKGTFVVFFKMIESKTEVDAKGNPKKLPILKFFYVFNVTQTEGLDDLPELVAPDNLSAEAVLAGYKDAPTLKHDSIGASYNPTTDVVRMPRLEDFDSEDAYFGTLFHELVHSTGHEKRLNRVELTGSRSFGDDNYSREELVAEMGAAMLCAEAGIEPNIAQSAAYLRGWISALGNDKKLVVSAASRATAAVDMILGRIVVGEEA